MAQQASSPSNIQQTTSVTPSDEEVEDIILSARFGELEEIQQYAERYGSKSLVEARDERGNGCLHMAAANGHDDVIAYLLPFFPTESVASQNSAGNTPLHWAALNGHLSTLRLLVPAIPKEALFLQNQFGRTPLSEAEANAPESLTISRGAGGAANGNNGQETKGDANGQDEEKLAVSKHMECAGYLLGFMELEAMKKDNKADQSNSSEPSRTAASGGDDEEDVTLGVAKMGVAASNGEFEFVEHNKQEQ